MLVLALAAPLTLIYALTQGTVSVSPGELWQSWREIDREMNAALVWQLRWPRALSAFAVGGMLALAGALLQVLLRNPLADPYILGVSGGAAVAALLAIWFGASGVWIGGGAFGGALLSMVLVFGLSRLGGSAGQNRLLLTGVVIAAGWGACTSLILTLTPSTRLQGMLFWLLGDMSYAQNPGLGWAVMVIGLLGAFMLARPLNLLARGELVAQALGANPARLRTLVYFLASALTAIAVTLAGSIGFVGLIVPHLLRLIGIVDHRLLLPASVLLGGSFLVLADTFARSWVAPTQLPVGVLTALLGVPVFLYLLTRTPTWRDR